jgi:hypothetical protein
MRMPLALALLTLCLALAGAAARAQDYRNNSENEGSSRDDRADVRLDYLPLRLGAFDTDVARRIIVVSEGQLYGIDLAGHVLQRNEDRIDLGFLIGSVTRFAYSGELFTADAFAGSAGLVDNTLILNLGVAPDRRPWLDDEVLGRLGGAVAPKPVVTLPPVVTRTVNTVVVLNDRSSYLIGGTIQHIEPEQPERLFGDIPIIGSLFNVFNTDTSATEIIVVVKPSIVVD